MSLVPTMAHTHAKAADENTVAGSSPTEVNQALRDRSLPEDHIITICTLANFPKPHKKKRQIPIGLRSTPLHQPLSSYPRFLYPPFLTPPPPYKPLVNPYLSSPSSTNDTHSNKLKQKKRKTLASNHHSPYCFLHGTEDPPIQEALFHRNLPFAY